jgi:hypothetical protein
MSNNFRKYPKTEARRIQGHSSTSLQIQGHSRTFKFCTNPVWNKSIDVMLVSVGSFNLREPKCSLCRKIFEVLVTCDRMVRTKEKFQQPPN